MSEDHKPNRLDERKRIELAGGVVVWAGTWRVGGVLAVSRAFGDRLLKRYVVAKPEMREEALGPDDEALILASDGVWDVVSNQDACNIIKDSKVRACAGSVGGPGRGFRFKVQLLGQFWCPKFEAYSRRMNRIVEA